MSQETNINAYKQELVLAERELDRAKSRVEELKRYIESVEPTKKSKEVKAPSVEPTPKVEKVQPKSVKVEVKTSQNDNGQEVGKPFNPFKKESK